MNETPTQEMPTQLNTLDNRPMLSIVDIRQQVQALQELLRAVMKPDVHYGILPGCDEPCLYKAGAEQICSMFRLAVKPLIEDLSSPTEARYRIHAEITHMPTGRYLGEGVGECSSCEEKYAWRAAICPEEWKETPESDRRMKWRRGRDGKPYTVAQVAINIADVRNTVLKMAVKRAVVDGVLRVTACSDIFDQDLEEMNDEVRDHLRDHNREQNASSSRPQSMAPRQTNGQAGAGKPAPEPVITDKQAKRMYAIARGGGWNDEQIKIYLRGQGIEHSLQTPVSQYDRICERFKKPPDQPSEQQTTADDYV
jgi:hypothetical protein